MKKLIRFIAKRFVTIGNSLYLLTDYYFVTKFKVENKEITDPDEIKNYPQTLLKDGKIIMPVQSDEWYLRANRKGMRVEYEWVSDCRQAVKFSFVGSEESCKEESR